MQLIPQIYLKGNKAVRPSGTTNPLFSEDPIVMANALKGAGVTSLFMTDLSIPHAGPTPHLSLLKKIHGELGFTLFVGGTFLSIQSIQPIIDAGASLIVLGSVAYQEPRLVREACGSYVGKIATHIDVKSGHVTIPGYTAAANLSATEYAERFKGYGIKSVFYSDVDAAGNMNEEHFKRTLEFCKASLMRIFITSEIQGTDDIEALIALNAPRLDGLVLSKSFYENRIDIKGAHDMIADLLLTAGDEPTISDE